MSERKQVFPSEARNEISLPSICVVLDFSNVPPNPILWDVPLILAGIDIFMLRPLWYDRWHETYYFQTDSGLILISNL